jgi:hypothetical protein
MFDSFDRLLNLEREAHHQCDRTIPTPGDQHGAVGFRGSTYSFGNCELSEVIDSFGNCELSAKLKMM